MTRSFTDTAGRTWQIEITVGAAKRIRSLAGVDVMGILDPSSGVLDRLADPVALVDAIFAAIKPAADELGVTDEEFAEAIGGDVLADAAEAMVEAVIDFFPHARSRENLRAAMAIGRERTDRLAETTREAIESGAIRTKIDAEIELVRQRMAGPPSGMPPESSGSTPTA